MCQWYQQRGIPGPHAELRPGRPRSYSHESVARCWTTSLLPRFIGVPSVAAYRHIQEYAGPPFDAVRDAAYRTKSFKLSADPLFVEKVRTTLKDRILTPNHALVLSVDEKGHPKLGSPEPAGWRARLEPGMLLSGVIVGDEVLVLLHGRKVADSGA